MTMLVCIAVEQRIDNRKRGGYSGGDCSLWVLDKLSSMSADRSGMKAAGPLARNA
jgi:hypothetical protein